jgi:arylsulfatase A-like enzyme
MDPAKKGKTDDAYALNVDLAPTILTAAGLDAPPSMQGKDIAPLYLAGKRPEWRTEFFYEHAIIKNKSFIPASEALVRKDWKYFYWPDFKTEQLFDLIKDPIEENDLIADPAQKDRLAEMRDRFAKLKAVAR